jgi:hypothetical protein
MNTDFTLIKIKRSDVPGKAPAVLDLELGELAINTYDAKIYAKRFRPGVGVDILAVGGSGPDIANVLYVTADGNDSNSGKKLGDAKRTIGAAVALATPGTIIKIGPGNYLEQNPISLPDQVSIVGDSLREVSITPHNYGDLFYVGNGNYFWNLSFTGSSNPGASIFSFDPNRITYINQSPYIQNCTNFIPNTIGLKVDGQYAIGPTKSMVLDSYTQYNQGGIGVSITNEGYAQLVSLFTICNEVAVFCGSGGACDLTNSNSSFGTYGLVSDGISPRKFSGIITAASDTNSDTFVLNLSTPTLNVVNAEYNNTNGIMKITTNEPHKFSVGMGITLAGIGFTCNTEAGIRYYPRSAEDGGNGYIFEVKTVAPGRYYDSYNLIQANRQEIIDTSFAQIAISYPSFTNPNPNKCKRDLGYIVDAVSLDVRDYTSINSIAAIKSYFNPSGTLLTNGLQGEVPQTLTAFQKVSDLMKLAITNNLTVKDLSVAADPSTGSNTDPLSCSNVRDFIDNLIGIFLTRIGTGDLNTLPLPSVSMASTIFTVNVGESSYQHFYNSGGTAKINVTRPYDGQSVYFGDLYYSLDKIVVGSGGTGYTYTPTVTISEPLTPWGVSASAVAEVKNGSVVAIEIVSSGRGYTTLPTITISSPDIGINTSTATLQLIQNYYTIQSSTPISSGICTITLNENLPYAVGVGTEVPFFKQSRILASGHSFEYIGSGTQIARALPSTGGVPIQENETDQRNGGLVVFTSTDQSGNFRIGDGVSINQNTGTITGKFYSKSLFSTMTPFILALGG